MAENAVDEEARRLAAIEEQAARADAGMEGEAARLSSLSSLETMVECDRLGLTDTCRLETAGALKLGRIIVPIYPRSETGSAGDAFIGRELGKINGLRDVRPLRNCNALSMDVGDVSIAELHDAAAPPALFTRIVQNLGPSVEVLSNMLGRARRRDAAAKRSDSSPAAAAAAAAGTQEQQPSQEVPPVQREAKGEYDIYLSHRHTYRLLANAIKKLLNGHGFAVFMGIEPRFASPAESQAQLERVLKSTNVMLVLVTPSPSGLEELLAAEAEARAKALHTPIEQRTVSVADLIAFTNEHACWDMPTYRVVEEVVKRLTAKMNDSKHMRFHDSMVARAAPRGRTPPAPGHRLTTRLAPRPSGPGQVALQATRRLHLPLVGRHVGQRRRGLWHSAPPCQPASQTAGQSATRTNSCRRVAPPATPARTCAHPRRTASSSRCGWTSSRCRSTARAASRSPRSSRSARCHPVPPTPHPYPRPPPLQHRRTNRPRGGTGPDQP